MAHRLDGRTSAASNFLIRLLSVRTMGDERPDGYSWTHNFHICNARVQTMIGSRPDGWSRIGNFLLWWTRVRTTAVRRPDGDIWNAILSLRRRVSGRDTTSSGRLIDLPFHGTWKLIINWSSTERRPDVLLKRPDGCKLDRTFSTQYSVWTEWLRRSDGWCWSVLAVWTVRHVIRMDGTVDKWASGRDGSIVRTANRKLEILLTCRQNRPTSLWIVESLFTASLHISDFVQTENEAKILTQLFYKLLIIWVTCRHFYIIPIIFGF